MVTMIPCVYLPCRSHLTFSPVQVTSQLLLALIVLLAFENSVLLALIVPCFAFVSAGSYMAIGSAAAAHGMLCSAWTTSPSGSRDRCARRLIARVFGAVCLPGTASTGDASSRAFLREELLRRPAKAGGRRAAAAGPGAAVGVVPRARDGAAAPAAKAEAQDAAGPARRREGQELPGRRRRRAAGGPEDAEQGTGERDRAEEHVAAERHGVGGVERGGPRGRRRGDLRQGGQAALAAGDRPVDLRPTLLPVQLGKFGPEGEGDGARVPELLPVPQVLLGRRPDLLVLLLLRRSKRCQERRGGAYVSRRTAGLAALHAVLADHVARHHP